MNVMVFVFIAVDGVAQNCIEEGWDTEALEMNSVHFGLWN